MKLFEHFHATLLSLHNVDSAYNEGDGDGTLAILELWLKFYSATYASVHVHLIENKENVPRYFEQDCKYIFQAECNLVTNLEMMSAVAFGQFIAL